MRRTTPVILVCWPPRAARTAVVPVLKPTVHWSTMQYHCSEVDEREQRLYGIDSDLRGGSKKRRDRITTSKFATRVRRDDYTSYARRR